jgi:putative transposase
MTNHIHMPASPQTLESLPKTLQSLGRRYVQHFNYRHKRTGTLWEGRYRATVVEAETYLFECMRYIELNPVRAGMVAHPKDFPWSNYRANAEGEPDDLVTPHLEYRRLGANASERKIAYRTLVKEPLDTEQLTAVRDSTNKGWALGGARFQAKIARLTERRAASLTKGQPKKTAINRV